MTIAKTGKKAYYVFMPIQNTLLSRQVALESQFDGPIPRLRRAFMAEGKAIQFPGLRMVVAAISRRRRHLNATAAAHDPALLRMGGFLTKTVIAGRRGLSGAGPR